MPSTHSLARFNTFDVNNYAPEGETEDMHALIDEYEAVLANLENMLGFRQSDALRGEHDFISNRIGALQRAIDAANGDM